MSSDYGQQAFPMSWSELRELVQPTLCPILAMLEPDSGGALVPTEEILLKLERAVHQLRTAVCLAASADPYRALHRECRCRARARSRRPTAHRECVRGMPATGRLRPRGAAGAWGFVRSANQLFGLCGSVC